MDGPGAQLQHDLASAQWYVNAIDWPADWRFVVGTFVPPVFAAYVRILHPVGGRSWAEVARERGVIVGPDTIYRDVVGPDAEPSNTVGWPQDGHLVGSVMTPLVEDLRPATGTPDQVWFALWEGYGGLQLPAATPRFAVPAKERFVQTASSPGESGSGWSDYPGLPYSGFRAYFLFHGPLDAVRDFPRSAAWPQNPREQSPNIWWPQDRAWCVASESRAAGTRNRTDRPGSPACTRSPGWPAARR